MMRRFTRRRRGGARGGDQPIDAAAVFARMLELETIPAAGLEALEVDEVPADFAAIGTGEAKTGGRILVAFSPRSGSHAALAALAVGGRLAEAEKFDGEFWAVSPEWTGPGRRVLGLAGQLPYRLKPVGAPGLGEGEATVSVESAGPVAAASATQIAGHLAGPADRDLFLRAARGLEGLAAKHGGALRGHGRAVEFVLLARRVGELRAEHDGVVLVTPAPQRSTTRLTAETLSSALDGFEGQLRKRLNDRRTREGEDGFRANAIASFRNWHSLRAMVSWPLGGSDNEVIDWVGVDVEGRPVIGAVRESLSLSALAEILEGAHQLQGSLAGVLAHAAPPVILDTPRLVVGGREIGSGVGRALDALVLSHELFEVRGTGPDLELSAIAAGEAPPRPRPTRRRSPRRDAEPRSDSPSEESKESDQASGDAAEARVDADSSLDGAEGATEEGGRGRGRGRGRRRSRRGRGRGGRDGASGDGASRDGGDAGGNSDDDSNGASGSDGGDAASRPRFDEVSLFDLDDEPSERDGGGRSRRGRGRGRRRGRSGSSEEGGSGRSGEDTPTPSADAPEPSRGRGSGRSGGADAKDTAEATDDSSDDADDPFLEDDLELEDVPDEVPDEAPEAPQYEDDEDMGEEGEADSRPRERDKKREGRRGAPQAPPVEVPRLPRKRSVILAHADRDSIAAAVLIARDIRMIEGIWVYPQSELMSFFRGVTTDLRDDTPIYVVGFTPSPAVDVLQAASLYRGRIQWFDHQDWPPEDLQALRSAIGEDAVNVSPACGSSLPAALDACSRRSRFTDKFVDLMAARFSHHDFEKWGRLWWWRLGEIAQKTGDCRSSLDSLLSGRPSDLAKEASGVETPPIPDEVAFVSHRDFRLVHFAGYGLVVIEVPPELDLHLTARVARERYGASLSLAYRADSELLVFAGDELAGRRSLDLGALVEHVCNKLEGVEPLPDTDHVARIRVRDRATHPDRVDDIVAEIAMGRSILER